VRLLAVYTEAFLLGEAGLSVSYLTHGAKTTDNFPKS
jgi:hypothetical protein